MTKKQKPLTKKAKYIKKKTYQMARYKKSNSFRATTTKILKILII